MTAGTLKRQTLSIFLCLVLVLATVGSEAQAPEAASTPPLSSGYPGQGAPETADELQALVAPIALYPDALVAQILSAATYPDQIAVADYWLEQNKNFTGTALGQAVDKQTWDPSVKALTQFPSVLNNMAQNLSWTSQLGEAYHNQQADVMTAIQTLRAKAKADGNLKSGSQITVVQQSPQVIVIQPTNPQVVYVPTYNPTIVYGTPYVVPGYSTADLVATGLLSFGAGMAVGAMMSGGCCGWGYSSWNCNWYHGAAYYHGGAYYGNPAWHGGYYGSGYDNYGNHYNSGYNSSGYHANNYNHGYNSSGYHANNYNHTTNVSGNTVNVNNANRQDASAYHGSDSASSRGWGGSGSGSGRGSTAFSGFGDRSGSSGGFGGGGWGDRSASSRGWGSRGGGGGWGGGGRSFGGGGRR
jgi:uncharacterized membrane protein YgcG